MCRKFFLVGRPVHCRTRGVCNRQTANTFHLIVFPPPPRKMVIFGFHFISPEILKTPQCVFSPFPFYARPLHFFAPAFCLNTTLSFVSTAKSWARSTTQHKSFSTARLFVCLQLPLNPPSSGMLLSSQLGFFNLLLIVFRSWVKSPKVAPYSAPSVKAAQLLSRHPECREGKRFPSELREEEREPWCFEGKMLLHPHKLNGTVEVLTRNSGPFGAGAECDLVTDVALVCCRNYCRLRSLDVFGAALGLLVQSLNKYDPVKAF